MAKNWEAPRSPLALTEESFARLRRSVEPQLEFADAYLIAVVELSLLDLLEIDVSTVE